MCIWGLCGWSRGTTFGSRNQCTYGSWKGNTTNTTRFTPTTRDCDEDDTSPQLKRRRLRPGQTLTKLVISYHLYRDTVKIRTLRSPDLRRWHQKTSGLIWYISLVLYFSSPWVNPSWKVGRDGSMVRTLISTKPTRWGRSTNDLW